MKRVVKYYTQRSNLTIRLRKSQGDKRTYQLYLPAAVCRMLSSDYVDIYVDSGVVGFKPVAPSRFAFKISQHGNGGGIISASSLVFTCPELANFKRFEFSRKSVEGWYLFSVVPV